ncbi:MAG: septal ring lytic transglycosylase RlpA family protein [Novosphingobium sp.]|nr:septal ring lytic transglycosylase RlpA family protein [Novosphingobium sp.]
MHTHRDGQRPDSRIRRLLPLFGALAVMTLASSASGEEVVQPLPAGYEAADSTPDALTPDTLASDAFTSGTDLSGEELGSGMASYYGAQFAGRRTASGEMFDPTELTAAHRTLPFGSKVLVTNEKTGQSVVVRINDRGPFARSRVIDVSKAAARELGLIGPGHGEVSLTLLDG